MSVLCWYVVLLIVFSQYCLVYIFSVSYPSPLFLVWSRGGTRQGFDDPDLLAAFPGGVSISTSEAVAGGDPAAAAAVGGKGKDKKEEDEEAEARAAAARAEEECALLERAAHYALMMNADLQVGWDRDRWQLGNSGG